jgi:hypothetical protein
MYLVDTRSEAWLNIFWEYRNVKLFAVPLPPSFNQRFARAFFKPLVFHKAVLSPYHDIPVNDQFKINKGCFVTHLHEL